VDTKGKRMGGPQTYKSECVSPSNRGGDICSKGERGKEIQESKRSEISHKED